MIELEEDLAFSFSHMRHLEELGPQMMTLAEETADEEEASLGRIRECLKNLPVGVDTREMEEILDDIQGTLMTDLYSRAKYAIHNIIEELTTAIPAIDQEFANKMTVLTEETKILNRQLVAIGTMIGGGG